MNECGCCGLKTYLKRKNRPCDGILPCSSCIESNKVCRYENKPSKSTTVPGKIPKLSSLYNDKIDFFQKAFKIFGSSPVGLTPLPQQSPKVHLPGFWEHWIQNPTIPCISKDVLKIESPNDTDTKSNLQDVDPFDIPAASDPNSLYGIITDHIRINSFQTSRL